MRLSRPLLQLPVRFDAAKLAAEVNALPPSAWTPHPGRIAGNEAVPLVSPNGELTDAIVGSMRPTQHLERCPAIMGLMAELGCTWGRSRLMALAPGAQVPVHVDLHYYWRTHFRLHIPVITNPGVLFTCNDETVHMAAGECWLFDSFALHNVQNRGTERRVHLVLDTAGGEKLWDLVDAAYAGTKPPSEASSGANGKADRTLAFEQFSKPKVMSPWELKQHIDYVLDHAPREAPTAPVAKRLDRFISAWHAAWSQFGPSDDGLPSYRSLVERLRGELKTLNADRIVLRNDQQLGFTIDAFILRNAVAPATA
jgi:hypothetical protein